MYGHHIAPPWTFQWLPGCPSSPCGSCALMVGGSVDNYELVRSCEHIYSHFQPTSRGAAGGSREAIFRFSGR